MQQHTSKFRDHSIVGTTLGNVQGCLRLDDLSEVGDGTHYLYFHMLGMFSFRHLTVEQTVRFWMNFLKRIGLTPDYVTVHPDKPEWGEYHTVPVRLDDGCTWTDGRGPPSYCTEFYVGDVEVGNIVNPYGDCIDVGFGLERLSLVLGGEVPTRDMVLRETTLRIIEDGYLPGNKKQGYVLRKLLRTLVREGIELDHPLWHTERERQQTTQDRYKRLHRKHGDQPPEWWWDTHGIDVTLL